MTSGSAGGAPSCVPDGINVGVDLLKALDLSPDGSRVGQPQPCHCWQRPSSPAKGTWYLSLTYRVYSSSILVGHFIFNYNGLYISSFMHIFDESLLLYWIPVPNVPQKESKRDNETLARRHMWRLVMSNSTWQQVKLTLFCITLFLCFCKVHARFQDETSWVAMPL